MLVSMLVGKNYTHVSENWPGGRGLSLIRALISLPTGRKCQFRSCGRRGQEVRGWVSVRALRGNVLEQEAVKLFFELLQDCVEFL